MSSVDAGSTEWAEVGCAVGDVVPLAAAQRALIGGGRYGLGGFGAKRGRKLERLERAGRERQNDASPPAA